MDVSNLQKHYPLLLEYLHDNGYSRCQIQWMRRCVKLMFPSLENHTTISLQKYTTLMQG